MSRREIEREVVRQLQEWNGPQSNVYERVWLDLEAATLRQVEFWSTIPAEAAERWPFNIYLRPIEFEGWEQPKRVRRFTSCKVEGAEDYGMVEYEGIGRPVRRVDTADDRSTELYSGTPEAIREGEIDDREETTGQG